MAVMTKRHWTAIILGAVTVLLVIWNVYVAIASPADTISQVIFGWAGVYPVLPFVIGVLMGHWFWPQIKRVSG